MLDVCASRDGAPPVRLVYGVTRDADLVALERLGDVERRLAGFAYRTCVADEASAHPRKGYVSAHVEPEWLNGGDVDIYLCGPAPMVDAVQAWLRERGVTPANLYFEKFSSSNAP